MTVKLEEIVPWGRSLDEYVRMFDLNATDLGSRILDCAGGPASFNAEMHQSRRTAISCDPIYQFSAAEIAKRIDQTHQAVLDATRQNRGNFVWRQIRSLEHLWELRKQAMKQFLEDLPIGVSQGRYQVGELPTLPFGNREFDLGLCSHFLFTYSNVLKLEFHLNSIRELCRVAAEVRIFPLLEQFAPERSSYVSEVLRELSAEGYKCDLTSSSDR